MEDENQYFQCEFDPAARKDLPNCNPKQILQQLHQCFRFHREENRRSEQFMNDIILTQYILWAGLKKFGQDGQDATIKELNQMLASEVFEEIDYSSLTKKEPNDVLSLKRNKSVKGRTDGNIDYGRRRKIQLHQLLQLKLYSILSSWMLWRNAMSQHVTCTDIFPTNRDWRQSHSPNWWSSCIALSLDWSREMEEVHSNGERKTGHLLYVKCSKAMLARRSTETLDLVIWLSHFKISFIFFYVLF